MNNESTIAAQRFKTIREDLGKTQSEFAALLDAGKTTADIERGKKKITGSIIAQLLHQFGINPLWIYGLSYTKYLELSGSTAPKVITMDTTDRQNMIMVPIKASAGYAHNILDTDWYQELPAFNIPLPQYQQGSYRAFQVQGDSMLPTLNPGEWVMARAVESIAQANNNRLHVIVTDDTVVVKKLHKISTQLVHLISLNTAYPIIEQDTTCIKELWEVNSKLSFNLDTTSSTDPMYSLQQGLDNLRQEIAILKDRV